MPHLFSPLTARGLELRNRIVMPPMCMYTASDDGRATAWHQAHYQARAAGGAGLVIIEATAIEPRGRISPADLGLWADEQVEPLTRIGELVRGEGAALCIQLAHAGRKAWSATEGYGPETPVAPSALRFDDGWQSPEELSVEQIDQTVGAWQAAAGRAQAAGMDAVEIHAAHGYLAHEFLSPVANRREDDYGGSLANRMRFLLRVTEAVRAVWPPAKPLLVRVSATDWVEGGLTPEEVVILARELKDRGVDLVHCSSGGMVPTSPPSIGPGYQVPFAEKVRREAGIATVAVGLITAPEQADEIVRNGRADLVALGRELLRHPYWPLDAARTLGQEISWPRQYRRARLP
jgi:2,4-dienoyl-CoA reductase-like NADH-dependent reductase (Old Yellow Enzyme family)